jgi:Starch-binding associating with outer membrane
LLMNLTEMSGGSGTITAGLSGLTQSDFLGAGEDASINPGYTNAVTAQQSPFWQDLGFAPSGAVQGNNSYYRACSYAVNYYANTKDTIRQQLIYALNSNGVVQGRAFGSVGANEHNSVISAMGPGLLKSPDMDAIILPATESLFLQAEAIQRGYLSGDAAATYQTAVEESFRVLGDADYAADAAALTGQAGNPKVNWAAAPDKVNLIALQAWAALNAYDPVESWSNWRRLGVPTDLPVSIYPGTTATHVPYRLLYPDTEYSYNAANVNQEGTISNLTSKIFWQP